MENPHLTDRLNIFLQNNRPVKEEAPIILKLNTKQAETLFDILMSVGGPRTTRRCYADEVLRSLDASGIKDNVGRRRSDMDFGAIYFR